MTEIEITTELDVARPEDDFKGCYVISTAKAQDPYRVWRVIEHLQDYESGDVTVVGEIKDDQWLGEILVDAVSIMAFATALHHPTLQWGQVFVEMNREQETIRCERLLLKRRSPGLVWYVEIGALGLEIKSMKDEEWLDYVRPLQRVQHVSFKDRPASWDGLSEH